MPPATGAWLPVTVQDWKMVRTIALGTSAQAPPTVPALLNANEQVFAVSAPPPAIMIAPPAPVAEFWLRMQLVKLTFWSPMTSAPPLAALPAVNVKPDMSMVEKSDA